MSETRAGKEETGTQVPVLFLDRDGTIIVERHYLSDPDLVQLEAGAAEGLRRFRDAGFRLVVVSNQSGLARGYFDETALALVNARLDALLRAEGIVIASWHHCPHKGGDGCDCRKPKPGMLDAAARTLPSGQSVDWAASIMIGDKDVDIRAGQNRGARAGLVLTGHGMDHCETARAAGARIGADLDALAGIFLEQKSF